MSKKIDRQLRSALILHHREMLIVIDHLMTTLARLNDSFKNNINKLNDDVGTDYATLKEYAGRLPDVTVELLHPTKKLVELMLGVGALVPEEAEADVAAQGFKRKLLDWVTSGGGETSS